MAEIEQVRKIDKEQQKVHAVECATVKLQVPYQSYPGVSPQSPALPRYDVNDLHLSSGSVLVLYEDAHGIKSLYM